MRTLLALGIVLAAALGVFLSRGLDQIARLRASHDLLGQRHAALGMLQRTVDLVPYDEYVALTERRAQARALVARRRQALSDASLAEVPTGLEERLAVLAGLRAPSGLADALRAQAGAAPDAGAALAGVLDALPGQSGLVLESLELHDGGASQPIAGFEELREIRASVVVMGAPAAVLEALEAFAVERGGGLPAPTVLTASLRRIEPERWGPGLDRHDAPPVRLSVMLSVLLPFGSAERG